MEGWITANTKYWQGTEQSELLPTAGENMNGEYEWQAAWKPAWQSLTRLTVHIVFDLAIQPLDNISICSPKNMYNNALT